MAANFFVHPVFNLRGGDLDEARSVNRHCDLLATFSGQVIVIVSLLLKELFAVGAESLFKPKSHVARQRCLSI